MRDLAGESEWTLMPTRNIYLINVFNLNLRTSECKSYGYGRTDTDTDTHSMVGIFPGIYEYSNKTGGF